jgi:hypothetical protein
LVSNRIWLYRVIGGLARSVKSRGGLLAGAVVMNLEGCSRLLGRRILGRKIAVLLGILRRGWLAALSGIIGAHVTSVTDNGVKSLKVI